MLNRYNRFDRSSFPRRSSKGGPSNRPTPDTYKGERSERNLRPVTTTGGRTARAHSDTRARNPMKSRKVLKPQPEKASTSWWWTTLTSPFRNLGVTGLAVAAVAATAAIGATWSSGEKSTGTAVELYQKPMPPVTATTPAANSAIASAFANYDHDIETQGKPCDDDHVWHMPPEFEEPDFQAIEDSVAVSFDTQIHGIWNDISEKADPDANTFAEKIFRENPNLLDKN